MAEQETPPDIDIAEAVRDWTNATGTPSLTSPDALQHRFSALRSQIDMEPVLEHYVPVVQQRYERLQGLLASYKAADSFRRGFFLPTHDERDISNAARDFVWPYEIMNQADWHPEAVFSLNGLLAAEWCKLFSTAGESTYGHDVRLNLSPAVKKYLEAQADKPPRLGFALIAGVHRPVTERVIEEKTQDLLSLEPWLYGDDAEAAFTLPEKFSPTYETYLSAQLLRVLENRTLMDKTSATLARPTRHTPADAIVHRIPMRGSHEDGIMLDARVWRDRDIAGRRPTVSGEIPG